MATTPTPDPITSAIQTEPGAGITVQPDTPPPPPPEVPAE